MSITEFLANFWYPEDFPKEVDGYGPWMAFESFDPKFTRDQLRQMARLGVIELSEKGRKFRLTTGALQHHSQQAA